MNPLNFNQKLAKSIGDSALKKAKNIERKTHYAKQGETSNDLKYKGYKKKTKRFPIDNYLTEMIGVDTSNVFVSINGRTGFVTVKFLDKK